MNIDKEIDKYLTENFGSIYGNQSVSEGIRYGYELAQKVVKENELLHSVSGSFFLMQERKPEKNGEYDVVTKRGRLIKANFIKGDKIGLDRWTCKSEDHRLNEGVIAWGYPINYR